MYDWFFFVYLSGEGRGGLVLVGIIFSSSSGFVTCNTSCTYYDYQRGGGRGMRGANPRAQRGQRGGQGHA